MLIFISKFPIFLRGFHFQECQKRLYNVSLSGLVHTPQRPGQDGGSLRIFFLLCNNSSVTLKSAARKPHENWIFTKIQSSNFFYLWFPSGNGHEAIIQGVWHLLIMVWKDLPVTTPNNLLTCFSEKPPNYIAWSSLCWYKTVSFIPCAHEKNTDSLIILNVDSDFHGCLIEKYIKSSLAYIRKTKTKREGKKNGALGKHSLPIHGHGRLKPERHVSIDYGTWGKGRKRRKKLTSKMSVEGIENLNIGDHEQSLVHHWRIEVRHLFTRCVLYPNIICESKE